MLVRAYLQQVGEGDMLVFLLFLHCYSLIHIFAFPPLFLLFPFSTSFSLPKFSLFLWEMTQNDSQGLKSFNQNSNSDRIKIFRHLYSLLYLSYNLNTVIYLSIGTPKVLGHPYNS